MVELHALGAVDGHERDPASGVVAIGDRVGLAADIRFPGEPRPLQ